MKCPAQCNQGRQGDPRVYRYHQHLFMKSLVAVFLLSVALRLFGCTAPPICKGGQVPTMPIRKAEVRGKLFYLQPCSPKCDTFQGVGWPLGC